MAMQVLLVIESDMTSSKKISKVKGRIQGISIRKTNRS